MDLNSGHYHCLCDHSTFTKGFHKFVVVHPQQKSQINYKSTNINSRFSSARITFMLMSLIFFFIKTYND